MAANGNDLIDDDEEDFCITESGSSEVIYIYKAMFILSIIKLYIFN